MIFHIQLFFIILTYYLTPKCSKIILKVHSKTVKNSAKFLLHVHFINLQLCLHLIGGWSGKAKFKLYFNKGGAIEFGKAMMAAGKLGE